MGCSLGIPAPTGSPPPAFAQAGCIPTLFSSNPTPSPARPAAAVLDHLRQRHRVRPARPAGERLRDDDLVLRRVRVVAEGRGRERERAAAAGSPGTSTST